MTNRLRNRCLGERASVYSLYRRMDRVLLQFRPVRRAPPGEGEGRPRLHDAVVNGSQETKRNPNVGRPHGRRPVEVKGDRAARRLERYTYPQRKMPPHGASHSTSCDKRPPFILVRLREAPDDCSSSCAAIKDGILHGNAPSLPT